MIAQTKLTAITGRAIPLRGNDVDTDRIMPARYLRAVTFEGLGPHVFEDDRKAAGGAHPFDDPRYQGAAIIVVNRNFGSGSSREHAPQGLMRWGIRAMVGEGFAEIFFGNCAGLGIPCVVLDPGAIGAIQAAVESDPSTEVTVDLAQKRLTAAGASWPFELAEPVRQGLLTGRWDTLAELLGNDQEVRGVYESLPYIRKFAAGGR